MKRPRLSYQGTATAATSGATPSSSSTSPAPVAGNPTPSSSSCGAERLRLALLPVRLRGARGLFDKPPPDPAAAAAGAAVQTMCRVSGKSAPPSAYWQLMLRLAPRAPNDWKAVSKGMDRFVSWITRTEFADSELDWRAVRVLSRERWRGLGQAEQAMWVHYASEGRAAVPSPQGAAATPETLSYLLDARNRLRLRGILLTWNGEWGFSDPSVAAVLARHGDDAGGRDALLKDLLALPVYGKLCERLHVQALALAESLGFQRVTSCFEQSTKAEDSRRVHAHVFMSTSTHKPSNDLCPRWHLVVFDGRAPDDVQPCSIPRGGSASGKRADEGHYYLQCPKVGKLAHLTNYPSHDAQGFQVKRRWVMNRFCARQLSLEDARSEVTLTREGVRSCHGELDYQQRERCRLRLEAKSRAIVKMVESSRRPFHPHKEEVVDFMKQFSEQNYGVLMRSKPLVLDGPSRYGKSEYMKALYGVADTLIVDCENLEAGQEPPLQIFHTNSRDTEYKAILFDECCGTTVHGNKMLFQGTSSVVTLGNSPTGQYQYHVLSYQTPLLIGTNDFYGKCTPAQRAWLEENVVYVKVDDYLYQREGV